MKKYFFVFGALVFSLLLFSGCIQTNNFSTTYAEDDVQIGGNGEQPAKTYECLDGTVVSDPSKCGGSINYKLGEDIYILTSKTEFIVNVSNVREEYENPNPFYEDKANVKWVMFDVYFENVGMKTQSTSELEFSVIDEKGREFEVYDCYVTDIPPDSYATESCYSEVSQASEELTLIITKGYSTNTYNVDLT